MQQVRKLHAALRALKSTQGDGFEGLIRDLFAEVSGQNFRLMKSGPQGGVDVLGESRGTGLLIGIEGKHYADATRLALDQLKSKIRDAAAKFIEMDLWVLATTRPISQGDVRELESVGERDGVDVMVLDWDGTASRPPDLAFLCAMAPVAVSVRLGDAADLQEVLHQLRASPEYESVAARLRDRLTSGLAGYGSMRAKMSSMLRRAMGGVEAARMAFDSHATLLASESYRIRRVSVDAALDDWWSSGAQEASVLVGDEGVGKTWGGLGWWLAKSESTADFPLTVFLPARGVSSADSLIAVAEAFQAAAQARDRDFWLCRLRRWLACETGKPRLLLIVDGLNQNWMFSDWSDFILSISGGERRGSVGLLMTARPDHFGWRLKKLQDLPRQPRIIRVEPFTDPELKEVLAYHSTTLDRFDTQLHPLLRVPRLCQLVVRRRKELSESGDITPERLIFEDWRHRQPATVRKMGDTDFKEFLAGMAKRFGSNNGDISRKELLESLTLQSGDQPVTYEGVLSDVVDGGWLESTGRLNHFKVNPQKLPYALGLALLDELSSASSMPEVRVALDAALDAYQGLDASVRILRCAAVFAMIEKSVSPIVRQALVTHWIRSQNFNSQDFQSFWRCIGECPDAVLDVAEESWFRRDGFHTNDEVLLKGIANAYAWTPVAHACESRLTKWFEGYWLDPLEGEVQGTVLQDDDALRRKRETSERAAKWRREEDGGALTFMLNLQQVDSTDRAWGCYRAVELLSWLPRAPMLRPLTAWAITRAIMGEFRQEEKIGWVLRWNELDHVAAEKAITERAAELAESGPIGKMAAYVLLRALASEAAAALEERDSNRRDGELADGATAGWCVHEEAADSCETESARRVTFPLFLPYRQQIELAVNQLGSSDSFEHAISALRRNLVALSDGDAAAWRARADQMRKSGEPWSWALQLGGLLNRLPAEQIRLLQASPKRELPEAAAELLAPLDAEAATVWEVVMRDSSTTAESVFWLNYLELAGVVDPAIVRDTLSQRLSHSAVEVRSAAMRAGLRLDPHELASSLVKQAWSYSSAASREEEAFGSLLLAEVTSVDDDQLVDRVHPEVLGFMAERFPQKQTFAEHFAEYVRSELEELRTANSRSYPRAMLSRRAGWELLAKTRGSDLESWLTPFLEKRNRRLASGWMESFPLLEAIRAVSSVNATLAVAIMEKLLDDDEGDVVRIGNLRGGALSLSSDHANSIRKRVLNSSTTDEKLYDFVAGLVKWGQEVRVIELAHEDFTSRMPGLIARGITLAGFLNPSDPADKLWRGIMDGVPREAWLASVVEVAWGRYARAKQSQGWFSVFFQTESNEQALVAFEGFLATVDSRFFSSEFWKRHRSVTWRASRKLHWALQDERIKAQLKSVRGEWKDRFLCSEPPLRNQYPSRQ